jgi:predicted AAA+ superfamily ATPase
MIGRQLAHILKKRLEKFPILTLIGPRQSGKSTLLKITFLIMSILIWNDRIIVI